MGLLDFILNVVALLLWLNWRSLRFDPLARTVPATLVGTLRPAEAPRLKGWQRLAGLGILLILRAVLYWQIGSPVHWTPKLNLGVIVPALRSDRLDSELAYSFLSFARVWLTFYFWLLFLAAVNHRVAEPDPLLKLLRLHLGRIAHWPWLLQLLLPILPVAALWVALHPLFLHLGVAGQARSAAHLVGQGFLVAASLFLTLKLLLPPLLALYLLSSYVYLGPSPVWDFISTTCHDLLTPLRMMRYGRFDFAPVLAILLLLLSLQALPLVVAAWLDKHNLTVWPP